MSESSHIAFAFRKILRLHRCLIRASFTGHVSLVNTKQRYYDAPRYLPSIKQCLTTALRALRCHFVPIVFMVNVRKLARVYVRTMCARAVYVHIYKTARTILSPSLNEKFDMHRPLFRSSASQFAICYRFIRGVTLSYSSKFQIVIKKILSVVVKKTAIHLISMRFVLFSHHRISSCRYALLPYAVKFVTAAISRYPH